jgi:DNA-binding transcriptional ArsR family regulator
MVQYRLGSPVVAPPPVSTVFAALGDTTRHTMVGLLAEQDRTVSELASHFAISLPGTLKHLSVLERAGVVRRTKNGRTVTVSLERNGLTDAEEWLRRTRTFWTNQLGRLADHFEEDS